MFAAYQSPENFAFGSKTKVIESETLMGAWYALWAAKEAAGFTRLAFDIEPDGTAADAAFAKAGQIVLFTIEKEAA